MIAKGLTSPRWKCRKYGCTDYVPSGGYYVGLPQAYCYYCHIRQESCQMPAPDYSLVSGRYQPTLFDAIMTLLTKY